MNIVKTEIPHILEAKICGYDKKKNVSYHLFESSHSLCLDKVQIILEQIQACERLLKYTKDGTDLATIKNEIIELKFALDLINF
jgi:NOL1/NOP2/fmu family ribosome biogenesis protein